MPNKEHILVITCSYDRTVDYLSQKFDGIPFWRYNLDEFEKYKVSASNFDITIENQYSKTCNFSNIKSIYYRKPALPDYTSMFREQEQIFAHKEIFSFMEGAVESFRGKCLSKPSKLRIGNNKIHQLQIASEVGFLTPNSFITNSKEILPQNKGTHIVKPVYTGTINRKDSKDIIQTNIFDPDIDQSCLKYCPAYFQEFINKDYDLRITFVRDKFYPVKIKSSNHVDWRKADATNDYSLANVPSLVLNQCQKMLHYFDLEFGCFDFVSKDGKLFFLELNTNGQWLWLERILNLKISESIIDYLE